MSHQQRQVAVFRNGANQAIRIPREWEISSAKAIIHKEGERLIIEPIPTRNRFIALLKTLPPLKDAHFPDIEDPPAADEDIFA